MPENRDVRQSSVACGFHLYAPCVQEKRKALLDRFYTSFDAQVESALVLSSSHTFWARFCCSPLYVVLPDHWTGCIDDVPS